MKVEKKGNKTIIKDTKSDIVAFIASISNEYKSFEKENLIVDITSNTSVTINDLINFKDIAKKHKKAKKSFVIVAKNIEFNNVPHYLNVVPSTLEAHDIIEMEEIERDLGF